MTIKWTKTKDASIADGYGRNVGYSTEIRGETYTIWPDDGTGWVLSAGGVHAEFRTLRDAKAAVAETTLPPETRVGAA